MKPTAGILASGACCLGLAALVYLELDRAPIDIRPLSASMATRTSSGAAAAPIAVVELARDAFTEVSTRTVFNPSRRLVAPKPVVMAPPPPPPATPRQPPFAAPTLLGVLVSDEKRIAVLRAAGATEALRLAEGEGAQGWTVKRIRADKVTLQVGASEHDVLLIYERAPTAPANPGMTAAPMIIGPMPVPPR
jgi:hypothetical protein